PYSVIVNHDSAPLYKFCFPFNIPPPTDTYTLSLHDALPISRISAPPAVPTRGPEPAGMALSRQARPVRPGRSRPVLRPRPLASRDPQVEGIRGPRRGRRSRPFVRANRREAGNGPRGARCRP